MTDLVCRDARGRTIDCFTQWEVNRTIIVEGIPISPLPRARFSNKTSAVSLIVKPRVVDDKVYIDVPNILLQQAYPVIVGIFYEYDDRSLSVDHILSIPVIPSPIPEDYVYINNVEYTAWVEVQKRAELLIHELENSKREHTFILGDSEPDISDIMWFDTSFNVREE